MSAITPLGNSLAETWEGLKNGRSGAARMSVLDPAPYRCQVTAELKDIHPEQFIAPKKARHMAYATQLAVIAAGQALDDACLGSSQVDRDGIGVIVGTACGGSVSETERATRQLLERNTPRFSPFQIMRLWPNMPS